MFIKCCYNCNCCEESFCTAGRTLVKVSNVYKERPDCTNFELAEDRNDLITDDEDDEDMSWLDGGMVSVGPVDDNHFNKAMDFFAKI